MSTKLAEAARASHPPRRSPAKPLRFPCLLLRTCHFGCHEAALNACFRDHPIGALAAELGPVPAAEATGSRGVRFSVLPARKRTGNSGQSRPNDARQLRAHRGRSRPPRRRSNAAVRPSPHLVALPPRLDHQCTQLRFECAFAELFGDRRRGRSGRCFQTSRIDRFELCSHRRALTKADRRRHRRRCATAQCHRLDATIGEAAGGEVGADDISFAIPARRTLPGTTTDAADRAETGPSELSPRSDSSQRSPTR